MIDRIRAHVEAMFQDAPKTSRAVELKEELIANLIDRYNDQLEQGKDEETAFGIVISGIGDVDDLIRGLKEQDVFNPAVIQHHQQRSAICVSVAVMIYILSIIFPAVVIPVTGRVFFSVGMMFVCWAAATGLLIFNAMSKPKYVKMDETIVEDFKEWKSVKTHSNALLKSIQSIVWTLALVLFFLVGFFVRGGFGFSWLAFILAIPVNQIIKLVFMYRED